MLTRSEFESALLLCTLLVTSVTATGGQRKMKGKPADTTLQRPSVQRIRVGLNVHVSKSLADMPHAEIHLAANPRDPLNLVGGSMVWDATKNRETVIAYTSFDGGMTWTPTLRGDDESVYSDPAVGFAPDGTAFFLQIKNTHDRQPTYYSQVYRSKDGGRTWLPPATMPMLDRNYIAFNSWTNETGKWAFINGSDHGERVARSKDGGATFEEARLAANIPATKIAIGVAPLQTLSDGKIIVPFFVIDRANLVEIATSQKVLTKANATLQVAISENGGESFTEPVTVGEIGYGHTLTSSSNHFSSAVDQSGGPFKDRVYLVWSDSFFSGGSPASGKKVNGANILLSYSSDGGKSWSKPTLINDDSSLDPGYAPVHFRPVVAVNRNGVVGVMWYDRRNSTNGVDFTPRFAASLDGGETFLPSVPVSQTPYAYNKSTKVAASGRPYGGGQRPPNQAFWGGFLRFDLNISTFSADGGHTAGLAADASGTFHPFWVDNRTGVSQIWTSVVTVNGKAMANGSESLSALEDVSGRILLRMTNPRFDLISGYLRIDAILENVSQDIIEAPLELRLIMLYSASGGAAEVVKPDNLDDAGAPIWDFTSYLMDNQLKPGQRTKPKTLEFQVSNVPPLTEKRLREFGYKAFELAHVEAKVLAKVEKRIQP